MIKRSRPATTSGFSVDAGEQRQRLADPEDPLLGTQRARQRVELRPSDRSKQHRIGGPRELQRGVRQRMARCLVASTADRRRFGFDRHAIAPEPIEQFDRFGDDLGTDAVTRQDGYFHGGSVQLDWVGG
jgi:hypothetical protein